MPLRVTLTASACLLVNTLSLINTICSSRDRSQSTNRRTNFQDHSEIGKLQYEDEDGIATRESLSSFDNGIFRFFIATGAISGLAISIFCVGKSTFDTSQSDRSADLLWLKSISAAAWVRHVEGGCKH